jgi:hypothetical protein
VKEDLTGSVPAFGGLASRGRGARIESNGFQKR